MRAVRIHSHACDRARAWVSLELDAELSQLERSLLESHMSGCAACRAFRADVACATGELRAAPLLELDQPISLPLRRRVRIAIRPLEAAAAVLAAAVGLGSVGAAIHYSGSLNTRRPVTVNADQLVTAQKRFQRSLIVSGKQPGPTGFKGKTRFPETM